VPRAPKATSKHTIDSMKSNRSKDTKPELVLRSAIYKKGFKYRLHYDIQDKPDIVFPGKKFAVFVDGCFWHRFPKCYKNILKQYLNYFNFLWEAGNEVEINI